MPSAGPNNPTAYDDAAEPGDFSWVNPTGVFPQDDDFAYVPGVTVADYRVQLYDIGSSSNIGSNLGTDANLDPEQPAAYRSYGGASNLWGATLTPAIVNDADFGVIIQWRNTDDDSLTDAFWIGTFGFTVPVDATIDGILVEYRFGPNNGGDVYPGIDNVRTTAYYTEAASGITGTASITQGANTISAAGSVSVNGSASITQGANTISAAGSVSVNGTASITQAANTISAAGEVITPPSSGNSEDLLLMGVG